MQTPVTTSTRLDAIDAERFDEMAASESFGHFRARIAAELERAREDCETQFGLPLTRSQGKVNALRTVLALPAMMIKEMRARK